MLSWLCALAVLGLSVKLSCSSQFYFSKGPFRRSEDCHLCYDNECLAMDPARCSYYVEADAVLPKDDEEQGGGDNVALKHDVDNLLFDMIDKVTGLSNNMECIPFISRYTNCNKENICLGCKTCSCGAEGRWNCSTAQPCHSADAPLDINHRVLVMVMETLIDVGRPKRRKRSVTDAPDQVPVNVSTITLEQMSEWLYGVKPLNKQEYSPTELVTTEATVTVEDITTKIPTINTVEDSKLLGLTTTQVATDTTSNSDTDYVAFDEVLRSIAVDTKSYNRRKLPMDNNMNNKTFDVDYMLMDEDNNNNNDTDNTKDDFTYLVNFMDDEDQATESTIEGATKIVIDLLETARQNGDNTNISRDYDAYNKEIDSNIGFENTNDIIEYNAANIMKRDVAAQEKITVPNTVPTVTLIVNTTNTTSVNNTDETLDLKVNVLVPINKIITGKVKELDDLKRIKENLQKFLKSDDEPENTTEKDNNTNNSSFSIYNLAMESGLGLDLRRANPSAYDKYMFKLKSDIFEVIRDIMGIQKHKDSDVPDDLKALMHAMKRYVYKTKMIETKQKKPKPKKPKASRRQMEHHLGRCDYISFKDCIVQVIEVIDKDMPISNALAPLSSKARKILKNVVKSFYIDEYIIPGLRINDPNYNMTNDLRNIGTKWQEMTANIISSSPYVTLYRMKLLHYVLTMDISKMNDALALIDFAHSRRMLHTLDTVSEDILDKINAGLTAIHNKIQIIIRYYSQRSKPTQAAKFRAEETTTNPIIDALENRKKKKRSFIKHIRSLLKTSKKDIAELLHRKVPKSEIVKQLAKKKLNEISEKRYSEYEETMKRWQKNLELSPRIKRSVLDTFKTRIKNIIPNYLRHKVNPRIKENKKNATTTATRKADDRKKRRKERKNRRTMTPTTKKPLDSSTPKPMKKNTKRAPTTTKRASTTTKRAPTTTVKTAVNTTVTH